MFKKLSVLTIGLLYLVTASGFALNVHYCMGMVRSVKIDAPAKTCSPVKKPMKCCRDKHVVVKIKDVHQAGPVSLLGKLFSFNLPKLPFEDFLFSAQKTLLEKFYDHGPPAPPDTIPHYLKNCNFRI